jgi:hypothetical protein
LFLLYPIAFSKPGIGETSLQTIAFSFLGSLHLGFVIFQIVSMNVDDWAAQVRSVYFSVQMLASLWVLSQQGDPTKCQLIVFVVLLMTLWNWEDSDPFFHWLQSTVATPPEDELRQVSLSDQNPDEVLLELFQPSHRRTRKLSDWIGSISICGAVCLYLLEFRNLALLVSALLVWSYFGPMTVFWINAV